MAFATTVQGQLHPSPGRPYRTFHAVAVALILLLNSIDAWLESLTRASSADIAPRCAMAEPDDAPDMAQLPAPNPDAQTTVNDFLDYTEFFPSDLTRSLTLIGDLDSTYRDAVQQVHELTTLYGQLPTLPEQDRPDPVALRKQIAHHLQKAINQREYAFTEASRLYEVTVRHCQRSSIIKRKLQAQPEPPSRDPTPPPVSPQAQRSYQRSYERAPHLRLNFDSGRPSTSSGRARDRHRKVGALPSRRSRVRSPSSASSDGESAIDVTVSPRKHKQNRDRHPKTSRARAPGVLGTNVHSSIAGISTSNALALLAPPPPDAAPGSKWAPWMKLTEYEMAVLRKQMKKNAVWTPSLTMVNRELERKHRTRADYEREKARCEEAGEEMLDEEPESLQTIMTASGLGQLASTGPPAPVEDPEPVKEGSREDGGNISIRLKPIEAKDGKKLDRLSQRQQAMRDAQELENATSKLQQAADSLKELTFTSVPTPASQKRKSTSRPSNKRKRDSTPTHGEDDAADHREESLATEDSDTRQPEAKRPRLQLNASAPDGAMSPLPTSSEISSPIDDPASVPPSPIVRNSRLNTESGTTNESTVQVPLAAAGPSTPKLNKNASKELNGSAKSAEQLPSDPMDLEEGTSSITAQSPLPPQPNVTAASSRPRRESVVPKATSPPEASVPPIKSSKGPSPTLESVPASSAHATRPRSARGQVPTPKAQSEEPKPNEQGRVMRDRETRRHSVFGQSALTGPAATRMSTRKKPPPKGEVTAAENGQKTVTNVKRAQGNKNKKKKKAPEEEEEEELEPVEEIDPNEPRYCFCDDISFGAMIQCDNNVSHTVPGC